MHTIIEKEDDLDSIQWSIEHEAQQLCSVHRTISLNIKN